MEPINISLEDKKKMFNRLKEGSFMHQCLSKMIGRWSTAIYGPEERGKTFVHIEGLPVDECPMVGKRQFERLAKYADETVYLGAGLVEYHFYKMDLV